jgi:hypothetical protein
MRIDFEVSRHGTVYLLRPITGAAHAWVDGRLPADAIRSGSAFAIDQRCIGVIIPGATENGLVVR